MLSLTTTGRKKASFALLGIIIVVLWFSVDDNLWRLLGNAEKNAEAGLSERKRNATDHGDRSETAAAVVNPQTSSSALLEKQKQQAHQVIESMLFGNNATKEAGVFDTPITTRDEVLDKGFPRLWNECAVASAFDRCRRQTSASQETRLEILLLGGSASTRPATNCSVLVPAVSGTEEKKLPGRFSDFLESGLSAVEAQFPDLKFRVVSHANGNHHSVTDAVLLDNTVNVNTTDIIIWEFLINDGACTTMTA